MKKILGPICSILAGALAFLFLSLPNIIVKGTVIVLGSATEGKTAWQVLKDYDSNVDGYTFFKIAVIVSIVFACLLILSGLVLMLKNFGLLKIKLNVNMCNNCLLLCYALVSVVLLIAGFVLCSGLKADAIIVASSASVAIGLWLNLAVAVVACLMALLFAKEVKAKKKRK